MTVHNILPDGREANIAGMVTRTGAELIREKNKEVQE